MNVPVSTPAQFRRRYRLAEPPIHFTLDGVRHEGRRGDTVLTAILSIQGKVRHTEFTGEPRAGFCLIGACQDCHVLTPTGQRLRACTTLLEEGMAFVTEPMK
ncbi:putative molibdopterin-dependent oxidoreductase YjgC [Ochrobactrum daejeonense]|uniref:Putative molibdopterin-dependent oxidoreductase YjgC n=1 Tax=Brucella daejeonensis TaxID=659015 RepID=A0A7W9EPA6_9HYPH|nr:(2Fe-2S)-binding protein [Brucella daejeonensis]MBB5703965.1 putative molibdopterin-dependent oxidoreductase YjgC [Brucella daejeonensis]NKB79967.1 (2Fe-2S)-binding protein [Brucella daejeonensis]